MGGRPPGVPLHIVIPAQAGIHPSLCSRIVWLEFCAVAVLMLSSLRLLDLLYSGTANMEKASRTPAGMRRVLRHTRTPVLTRIVIVVKQLADYGTRI